MNHLVYTLVLLLAVAGLAGCGSPASRANTFTFSVVSEENQGDRIARFDSFRAYLSERLGRPVDMHIATDYAGTVQAFRAGKVDLAFLGPAAYALAYTITEGNVEPIVSYRDLDGSDGYHSVVAVRADSSFQSLEDLEGHSLAFPDPNSTSGFLVPNYYFRRQGIDVDTFFSRTGLTGNHENGILAVIDGNYDAATTFWNNELLGNIQRMEDKGMIEKGAVRIIWKSPLIPNEPWTIRKDIDPETKQTVLRALMDLQEADPTAWEALTDGKIAEYFETNHEHYVDVIEMRKQMLEDQRS